MIALLLFVIFGLIFGYFATMNTVPVTVHFGTYTISNIPLYMLVLAALAIGIAYATLFYLYKSFTTSLTLSKKEKELTELHRENMEVTKKNHQLELENTRLKSKNGESEDNDELSI